MNAAERLQMLASHAMFMDKQEWVNFVKNSYPQGPTPEGPPWTDEQLFTAYDRITVEKD